MTLQEIKDAINEGKSVHWVNEGYTVIKGKHEYLISHARGHCIGLTWADGKTLNGKEEDFYIGD